MSKIVDIARTEVGVTENPPNSNNTKYNEWFGFPNAAWCAMFVSWVYAEAGKPLPMIGWPKGFCSVQAGFLYFQKHGMIVTYPQPGDIVLFDWNGDKRYDHTGIYVSKLSDTKFKTIEGNTSLENDSNGGEVMERVRFISQAIFVRVK